MIQPMFLQAFASTPVQAIASQRATQGKACADCAGSAENGKTAEPVDELQLSEEALAAAEQGAAARPQAASEVAETDLAASTGKGTSDATEADQSAEGHDRPVRGEKPPGGEEADEAASVSELTEEQQQQVAELKTVDREVRSHEQAHLAAAGPYATGGPSFEYQEGPDGRRYAVGGEVGIDTSPVSGDPEATIQKAQQIRAAALAPASPSSQDQSVAAAATQMESQARAELSQQNQAQLQQTSPASYGESAESQSTGTLLDLVA